MSHNIDEKNGTFEIDRTGNTACITEIQRFSVHDGPGIRTIVFLKGCPLRCKWCQNPETNSLQPEIIYTAESCVGCGKCVESCTNHAIEVVGSEIVYHRKLCTVCGACAKACGPEARKQVGERRGLNEIQRIVLSDKLFYQNTNGGLTVSGGEPTMQADFVAKLFDAVKAEGINTAMETCGMCEETQFYKAVKDCDLLLFDIKHMNSEAHKKYTGVGNEQILRNLRNAARMGKETIIRIPLIPGVNDGEESLKLTSQIARECKVKEIHILPFHQMGQGKWQGLDKDYEFEQTPLPTQGVIEKAINILRGAEVTLNVGGYGEYKWL